MRLFTPIKYPKGVIRVNSSGGLSGSRHIQVMVNLKKKEGNYYTISFDKFIGHVSEWTAEVIIEKLATVQPKSEIEIIDPYEAELFFLQNP